MTQMWIRMRPGWAMVLLLAAVAVANPHPYLADSPANDVWLAPAGTGHVQNLKPLDPAAPADLVIRRDKILGRSVQLALVSDAPVLMLAHGEAKLALRLSGRADTPHVLELSGEPAKVLIDDKPAVDPDGAWTRMLQLNGDDLLTLRFVGATKVKLQFDADQIDPKAAASFFGISADPSNPAYQKIARRTEPQAVPKATSPAGVEPEHPVAPPPLSGDSPGLIIRRVDVPRVEVASDFPAVTSDEVLAKVQPTVVRVEGKCSRAGLVITTHATMISDTGLAVASLDAIADARELRLPDVAGGVAASVTAFDESTGLALIQAELPPDTKVIAAGVAKLPPAESVGLWLVTSPPSRGRTWSEGAVAEPRILEGERRWLAGRYVMQGGDGAAAVVNPLGELVGVATWQVPPTGGSHYALAAEHVAALQARKADSPPSWAQLNALREAGRLPGFVPMHLHLTALQPTVAVQREAINLKRSHACRACDGKGEVDKQIHRQSRGNMGAGKDWYESVQITCPTCQGHKLAPGPALAKLLLKLGEAVAWADPEDVKWPAIRDFAAETFQEVLSIEPGHLQHDLEQVVPRPDPARLAPGEAVLVHGVIETPRELALLARPDCALLRQGDGSPVVLVDMKLNRTRPGQPALAIGLFAGHLRLPTGQVAPVLQHATALPMARTQP